MRLLVAAIGIAIAATVASFQAPRPQPSVRAEQAYRANNAGVAALERFDYATAAKYFRQALETDPSVHIARLNLAIALHYGGDAAAAQKEALAVASQMPQEPRAWFVAGLAARSAADTSAAVSAFERVLQIDPADAAALTTLGQLYMETDRPADAVARLSAAVAAEPFNATAAYNLARALLQSGRSTEGQEAMKKFQSLREAPYAVTYTTGYLQQGRFAEALVSTGSEPQLVDPAVPQVTFSDVTTRALGSPIGSGAEAFALADVDGDRDLDLVVAGAFGIQLLLRDGAAWKASSAIASTQAALGVMVADYDNDNQVDVMVVRPGGVALWRQTAPGAFSDVTAATSLGKAAGGRAAAFVDIDHDGDLDFVSAPASAKTLDGWRNNGDGKFAPFEAAAGLTAAVEGTAAVVATDFDNRRDVDLLVAGTGGIVLLKNLRDGRFQDVAQTAGLRAAPYRAVATGDLNADGRTDFLLGRSTGPAAIATSDGANVFRVSDAPEATASTHAAQLFDYDADGVLDLATLGASGLSLLRGTGAAWVDVSTRAGVSASACTAACALGSADIDDDGDVDLVAIESGRLRIWQNDAKSPRSLSLTLKAQVSNRSAAGARIEMRAGSLLRRFERSISTPSASSSTITFGLGTREAADVVRVVWPSGIVQAEEPEKATGRLQRIEVTELDRKPSSCPYLFTWNGSRFEFATDFLGGGEIGYWLAPGVRNVPDPEEYVRIRGDQLAVRDGRHELRITNELEEALFIDRLSLLAVMHREGTEIYPNEGLLGPPFPAHRLFVTREAGVPERVIDDHGHDVRALVEHVDRRAPSDFELERFRGYAADHYVELTIPARDHARLVLLLAAWTDYAFSSDNVAAHQAGKSLHPPTLEIEENGRWQPLVKEVGIPVGRPQTVVVDLSGRVPNGQLRLRIRTNMRIYWDQIRFATVEPGAPRTEALPLQVADLKWRGFSAELSPDGREPFSYDYSRVLPTSPWKLMPGRYTREGDVRELLAKADDLFVVSRPGDEVGLSFAALRAVPSGWTRTFLLHADGFSKEMDPNSASPDVAAPLPYHGMTQYPYDPLTRPLTPKQREYVERYNTRVVTRSVSVLTGSQR